MLRDPIECEKAYNDWLRMGNGYLKFKKRNIPRPITSESYYIAKTNDFEFRIWGLKYPIKYRIWLYSTKKTNPIPFQFNLIGIVGTKEGLESAKLFCHYLNKELHKSFFKIGKNETLQNQILKKILQECVCFWGAKNRHLVCGYLPLLADINVNFMDTYKSIFDRNSFTGEAVYLE